LIKEIDREINMPDSLLERIPPRGKGLSTNDWPGLLEERKRLVLEYFQNNDIRLPNLGSVGCLHDIDVCTSGFDNLFFSCNSIIGGANLSLDTQGIFWRLSEEITLPQKRSWRHFVFIDEYKLKNILGFSSENEWIIATVLCYWESLGQCIGSEKAVVIQIYRVGLDEIFRRTKKTPENLWYEIGRAINGLAFNYGDNRNWIPGTWDLAKTLQGQVGLPEIHKAECAA